VARSLPWSDPRLPRALRDLRFYRLGRRGLLIESALHDPLLVEKPTGWGRYACSVPRGLRPSFSRPGAHALASARRDLLWIRPQLFVEPRRLGRGLFLYRGAGPESSRAYAGIDWLDDVVHDMDDRDFDRHQRGHGELRPEQHAEAVSIVDQALWAEVPGVRELAVDVVVFLVEHERFHECLGAPGLALRGGLRAALDRAIAREQNGFVARRLDDARRALREWPQPRLRHR
jgi:hypothetical protein